MKKVKVSATVPAGCVLRLFIDGSRLYLKKGRGERQLASGSHALQWWIAGNPGSEYTLDVTLEAAKIADITKAVPKRGWDAVSSTFDVP